MTDYEYKDEVIGEYHVKCGDTYISRMIFEVICSVCTNGRTAIIFEPDGIHCSEATRTRDILVKTHLSSDHLLLYKREGQAPPNKSVVAHVKVEDIVDILRNLARCQVYTLEALYNQEGIVTSLNILTGDTSTPSIDQIRLFDPIEVPGYVDLYQKYYSDRKPTVKTTISWFFSVLNRFKNRKCTKMEFRRVHDGLIIKGLVNQRTVTAYHVQSDAEITSDIDGMYEDEEERVTIGNESDNGPTLTIVDGSVITIDLTTTISWLVKISRTSDNPSVLKIYLEEDLPLILRVLNRNIGETYYTFTRN